MIKVDRLNQAWRQFVLLTRESNKYLTEADPLLESIKAWGKKRFDVVDKQEATKAQLATVLKLIKDTASDFIAAKINLVGAINNPVLQEYESKLKELSSVAISHRVDLKYYADVVTELDRCIDTVADKVKLLHQIGFKLTSAAKILWLNAIKPVCGNNYSFLYSAVKVNTPDCELGNGLKFYFNDITLKELS